jgi:lipoprotein-anchoring transpeptidase ErfK/SrfK
LNALPRRRLPLEESLVAEARDARLPIFEAAGRRVPMLELANPLPSGAPRVLLVTKDEGQWLKVLVPVRPNGTTGWVRDIDVKLYKTPYRIVVQLEAHHVIVYRGKHVFLEGPIAVGTVFTPTPVGRYFLTELLRQPNPNGAYGPFAYGMSGYSNVLTEFAGGDGELGLHGTNDPASLGTDVSHGCIRLRNDQIVKLSDTLPLGVPVRVVA